MLRIVLGTLLVLAGLASAVVTVLARQQNQNGLAAVAAILSLVIALLSLSWTNALYAALAAGLSGLGMARLAMRQIGGQTGDVLGGAEQVSETAILVLLAARLAQP